MKRIFQQTMNMVMALALSVAGVGCAQQGLDPVGGDGSENADLAGDGSENADLAGDGSEAGDESENDAVLSGETPSIQTVCADDYCCYWSNNGDFLACDG